jgi:agmatinase
MKMKFVCHNCEKKESADVVLVGVQDERGSRSSRHGASMGPNAIRKASQECLAFFHKGKQSILLPERGFFKGFFFDAGNIRKDELDGFVRQLSKKQFPVVLGGDHSITYYAVKGLGVHHKKIAVVYLDAHPDMISSETKYFGSVVSDMCTLPHINSKKIVEVGVRSIEQEELKNLKSRHIRSFTALDVAELGVVAVFSSIKKVVGKTPLYLSIDLDVIDPAFAPGVDTPAPFGITPNEYLSLIKHCAELNLVGFDIMELSPKYDTQQMTAQLAAKTILELLGSRKKEPVSIFSRIKNY